MSVRALIVTMAMLIGLVSWADDPPVRHFTCPVSKLEIIEGTLPLPKYGNQLLLLEKRFEVWPERQVYPRTFSIKWDGKVESELVIETGSGGVSWDHVFLAVRTTRPGPVTGQFEFVDDGKKTIVWFRLPENANTVRAAEWFQYGQAARIDRVYRELLRDPDTPGQAWFRFNIQQTSDLRNGPLKDLWRQTHDPYHLSKQYQHEPMEPDPGWVSRLTAGEWGPAEPWRVLGRGRNRNDYAELLSGGRAVAENLQLDRQLRVVNDPKAGSRTKIESLKGITIRAFDWSPHIRGLRPTFDTLAALIPADQHAVFFPDAAAAVTVLDEIDRTGLPIFNISATQSVDARLTDRYVKQLAIPAAQLGKLLPASLVTGVAVTGSDLYYDTGTDVAVLFATNRPAVVKQLLFAGWPAMIAANPDAVESAETIGEIKCRALRTPDRRVCAYLCEVPGAILLTNSPAQVRRMAARPANAPTLDSLPEYTFFRDRYRRGEADETAFALLSDEAIRRWCSPRWRIGHQRRIRTGALLADAQAKYLTSMVAGVKPRTVDEPGLGPIEIGTRGVSSAIHGTRLFQTPIAEVEIEEVSTVEAQAYERWRDSYQQNWSQFFDPIAVRLTVKNDRLAADLSVMPLIASTDYREMISVSAGAKLPPAAGDPHPEAIAHFTIGINRQNPEFAKIVADLNRFAESAVGIESWIGEWATLYLDDDPIWAEFAKSDKREWGFWDEHHWGIPAGLAVAVRDPAKLAVFLIVVKAMVDKHVPNLVEWKSMKFHDTAYTCVAGKEGNTVSGMKLYSLALPEMWLLTLDERLLHRAIDRHLARKDGKQFAGPGWLGDSVAFAAKPQAAKYLREWSGRSALSSMQSAAWANLPILNEWHSLNSSVDPVAFHEKWWGERLTCPAGSSFVWNAADGTMESKTLGHPGRPKGAIGMLPTMLNAIRDGQFGITFERDGLRARVDLRRE